MLLEQFQQIELSPSKPDDTHFPSRRDPELSQESDTSRAQGHSSWLELKVQPGEAAEGTTVNLRGQGLPARVRRAPLAFVCRLSVSTPGLLPSPVIASFPPLCVRVDADEPILENSPEREHLTT